MSSILTCLILPLGLRPKSCSIVREVAYLFRTRKHTRAQDALVLNENRRVQRRDL